MERIDGIVGNVHADDDLAALRAAHESDGSLERIVIDAENRRRSRFRATTDAETDVGVIVDKPAVSAGDVLLVEDDRMIVVAFEPRDALAVSLPAPTPETLSAAVELGHRVGNQHWDLAIEGETVYVPLAADRHIVERVVDDIIPGAEIRETTVEADLFVTAVEDETPGHTHGADSDHEHAAHDQRHDHGHQHGHERGSDCDHHHEHTHDH